MTLRHLVIAEPAAHDLEGSVDYIAFDNPVAAEKVYRGIVSAAEKLLEFPTLGRPGRLPGTRELSIVDLRYLLVYEVDFETVTILAVFHASRDLVKALHDRIQAD